MTNPASQPVTLKEFLRAFRDRRRLWLAPTIVCGAVGVVCALTMSRKWEASQALIVRQEAVGSQSQRLGSFSSVEDMKRIQETILEIAKSHSVLAGTLEQVGPPSSLLRWSDWPSEQEIEDFRGNIRMTPPGGAEFGMTEVVYLAVRSGDRERAQMLITKLCDQLEDRFMEVRDTRAQSVTDELQKTVALAEEDLEAGTAKLAEFESGVGADLTELRMLLDSPSGTSDLRQKLVALEDSKQQYAAQLQQQQQLLEMLNVAKDDPLTLIATPNSLLDAQPALRRLKEGLIEAQLLTSRLLGRRSASHPEVLAAQHAEEEVRESLRKELGTAIRGVEVDLEISDERLASLEKEIAAGTARLERLATLRARYANLVALTQDRTRLLEQARMNLSEARASQASARAASLIGRIDAPRMGTSPVGPGRTVVAGAGVAGGFAIGVALVFLVGVPASTAVPAMQLREQSDRRAVEQRDRKTVGQWDSGTLSAESTSVRPDHVVEPSRPIAMPVERSPVVAAAAVAGEPSNERFGMFRGKTLRQALEEVRRRDARAESQVSEVSK